MEKIIVTRHSSVEKYIRIKGMVPSGTPCFPSVSPQFVEGKHVYGIIPFSLAAKCELFTEIKITLRRGIKNEELSEQELEACVKEVRTYRVNEILKEI